MKIRVSLKFFVTGCRSVTTEENNDLIEELICSQEEPPHINVAPHKIAEQTRISHSSIRSMLKEETSVNSKGQKTPEMNDGLLNMG